MKRHKMKKSEGGGNYFAAPANGVEFFSTGSTLLNLALGGGWAERRIGNIVGDKSTGKTLLGIEACANFARKYEKGGIRYCEAESAFDTKYAEMMGLPVDRVDFTKPIATVEALFADLEHTAKMAKYPTLYIVDSLDALSDDKELERDIEDNSYGTGKAKKLSELFRRLTQKMATANLTLLIISQVRQRIGITFGEKMTRAGGKALDFYASQVPWLANLGRVNRTVGKVKRTVGVDIRANVKKNKVGLPFREAEFTIRFGYGIDDVASCLDWLDAVKTLGKLGMTEKQLEKLEQRVLDDPDEETLTTAATIRQLATQRWYEIETSFLPKSRKYT